MSDAIESVVALVLCVGFVVDGCICLVVAVVDGLKSGGGGRAKHCKMVFESGRVGDTSVEELPNRMLGDCRRVVQR